MIPLLSLALAAFLGTPVAEPTLVVEPAERLFADPLTVRVEGVPHGAMVRIEATYRASDGGLLHSHAVFYADDSGVIDVAKDYATDGTYEGVEPHGLIWSALPEGDPTRRRLARAWPRSS